MLLRGNCVENNCSITVVPWDCFAGAYLDTKPGGLRVHRMLQALCLLERLAIEVAPEDRNGLRA